MSASQETALSVRGALAVVFVNRYAVLGLNIVSLMIMARLVTPAETGLFSIAASIVMLAQALRDFGIAEFLVQEKELTQSKIRTAFGMNLVLAWSLGVIVFLMRNWIANLYGTPELSGLIAVVCGSFFVAPFSSTVLALLNRRMDFVAMLKISVASNLASSMVSIPLAYLGWGAMALSLGMLTMNVTIAIVTAFFMRSWDHFVPSLRDWRKLASFGIYMSGANIVNQVGGRVPELIIGRLLGFEALGQFNRARGIVALFYDAVVSSAHFVAFPAFSAAYRAGEDVYAPYLRATTLITGAVLPVLAVLAVVSKPLVHVMLGDQWLPAATLMPILILGTAIAALAPIAAPVLNATGKIHLVLRSTFYQQGCQLVFMGIFGCFGMIWLAISQVFYNTTCLAINIYYLRQGIGVQINELYRAFMPSVQVAFISAVLPWGYVLWRGSTDDADWLTLSVVAVLATFSWFAAIYILGHTVRFELEKLSREIFQYARFRI